MFVGNEGYNLVLTRRQLKIGSSITGLLIVMMPFQNCGPGFVTRSTLNLTDSSSFAPENILALQKGQKTYAESCQKCHGELSATNVRMGDAKTINDNIRTNPSMQSLAGKFTAEDIGNLVLALAKNPADAICGTTYLAGRTTIHRLTNQEYNNTARELLYITSRPGDKFPPDVAAATGFKNDSDSLTIYPELMASYYNAAESLAAEVLATKGQAGGSYSRIAPCIATATDVYACASTTVQNLGGRAFRRPLNNIELTNLMAVYSKGANFDQGLSDVITALMVNPKFLFVSIVSPQSRTAGAEFNLSQYELASRLSYFLWQSMPDAELFNLARDNRLSDAAVLKAQVERMLKDAKVGAFRAVLSWEYAGLNNLYTSPVATLDNNLRAAMLRETEMFIEDMINNNLSIINLVNGQFSYVNKQLADHYGIAFPGSDPAAFVRMPSSQTGRVGIGSQASILTATAGEISYTHPVKRGHWVAKQILCDEPPPPPPNLPTIDFETNVGGTIRERLKAHTTNATCISCHKVMDPVGLGLENYDSFGRWRTIYSNSGLSIDATGLLPDGTSFKDSKDLYTQLGNSEQVRACLPKQILTHALTRATGSKDDKCVSQALGASYAQSNSKLSDLIFGIVSTNQFKKQTGEAP